MQIVIKIDDIVYTNLMTENGWRGSELADIIKHGTPLPKGHGRLVDEKEVYKKFYCRFYAGVAKEILEETPTIIEADTESEDKNENHD